MKYLVQDGDKVKKATMEGLEDVKEGTVIEEDFNVHGTTDLGDIIGHLDKEVPMGPMEVIGEKTLYSYRLAGFKDISALAIKYPEGDE